VSGAVRTDDRRRTVGDEEDHVVCRPSSTDVFILACLCEARRQGGDRRVLVGDCFDMAGNIVYTERSFVLPYTVASRL